MSMQTGTASRTADRLKEKLLAENGDKIRKIILYGSRARGEAARDSDFDLLVVEKDPVDRRSELHRLRTAIRDLAIPVDLWVMGETEFEETKNIIGGLAYPANRYGIVLHENP